MEPTAKKVSSLVDMVRSEELVLPEIQRGYVWNRPQIRDLVESLYHDYPAGAIMLWNTEANPVSRALGVSKYGDGSYFRWLLIPESKNRPIFSSSSINVSAKFHV